MTITHIITTPADLAAIYRQRANIAQRAADSCRAKHQRDCWQVEANIWTDAADIAATTLFQPEGIR